MGRDAMKHGFDLFLKTEWDEKGMGNFDPSNNFDHMFQFFDFQMRMLVPPASVPKHIQARKSSVVSEMDSRLTMTSRTPSPLETPALNSSHGPSETPQSTFNDPPIGVIQERVKMVVPPPTANSGQTPSEENPSSNGSLALSNNATLQGPDTVSQAGNAKPLSPASQRMPPPNAEQTVS